MYSQRFRQSYIAKIPLQQETFVEDANGAYAFVLDPKLKLSRIPKRKAKGLKTYGTNNVGLEWIRRNYWGFESSNYNPNPRVWFLDIETTAKGAIDTARCPEKIVSIKI